MVNKGIYAVIISLLHLPTVLKTSIEDEKNFDPEDRIFFKSFCSMINENNNKTMRSTANIFIA